MTEKKTQGPSGGASASDPREIALDILIEITERGELSHIVLRQALDKYRYLSRQDRAFITRTVEGTLETMIRLDYILDLFSRVPVKEMKPFIRALLRISSYQILYMDRVPDRAVCSEAVRLAEKRRFSGLKGFVNGVLRNLSRHKDEISFPDDSIRYGMPRWILDMWEKMYGHGTVLEILDGFLRERPVTVRCCTDRARPEDVAASLLSQGVEVVRRTDDPTMMDLRQIDRLELLDAFREGRIVVQDYSSACVARAAGIQGGDLILDVCGAPGGKALHAAELLRLCRKEKERPGRVIVRDISPRKVEMIRENAARCGRDSITAQVWDARVPDAEMLDKADVVFADLPCSGLGVMGRKPDIRYRLKPEDIPSLAELQRQILSVIWRYVRPGGTLVYSTCTISKEENEDQYRWILENLPFQPVDISDRLKEKSERDSLKEGFLQLLPGRDSCDGFFLCVLRRI